MASTTLMCIFVNRFGRETPPFEMMAIRTHEGFRLKSIGSFILTVDFSDEKYRDLLTKKSVEAYPGTLKLAEDNCAGVYPGVGTRHEVTEWDDSKNVVEVVATDIKAQTVTFRYEDGLTHSVSPAYWMFGLHPEPVTTCVDL